MSRRKRAAKTYIGANGSGQNGTRALIEARVTLARTAKTVKGIPSDARHNRERSRVRITDAFANTVERYFEARGQQLDRPLEVRDSFLIGLALRREPTGRKSWHYGYSLHGRRGRVKLGDFPAIGVNLARRLARVPAGQVALGIDPVVKKREAHRTP